MSKLTIEITEQQEEFLKKFAEKHYPGSQDNNLTECPIHLVQTRRERVIDPDYESADKVLYCVPDWGGEGYDSAEKLIKAYYEDEDCPIPIVSYDEAYKSNEFLDIHCEERSICGEEDYFEAYGIEEDFYYKVHMEYYYDTVATFFILDEAKRYMKYQGHNLIEPRTYTIGAGYGNLGEYNSFWRLLFGIGKQIIELEG